MIDAKQFELLSSLEYLKTQHSEKEYPAERELISTAIDIVGRELNNYSNMLDKFLQE